METDRKEQCPEFPYFGASYPDGCCIDGYLYDMDDCDDYGNLYEPVEKYPCPFCNWDEFKATWNENAEDLFAEIKNWVDGNR